ncbi:hypothetical protein AB0A76_18390 [Streptomyces exfoliatus]|uniref:Uncharacterized protein n=1 Tax=Streptomyces exfoliatus TaxID=1905 RepID=A0ABV3CY68_STREX
MGRLRTAVQTLAGMELPPDELLAHLDDLVLRLSEEEDGDTPPAAARPPSSAPPACTPSNELVRDSDGGVFLPDRGRGHAWAVRSETRPAMAR